MKHTICFYLLQSLPVEQQRQIVKRLQKQNEQCGHIANERTEILTTESKPINSRARAIRLNQE